MQVYIHCTDPITERLTVQCNNVKVCLVVFVWSQDMSNVSAFQFCFVSFNTYEFPGNTPFFHWHYSCVDVGRKMWVPKRNSWNNTLKNIQSLCYKNCRMIIWAVLSRNNMSKESDLGLYHQKLLQLLKIIAWSENTKEGKSIKCYTMSLKLSQHILIVVQEYCGSYIY